MRFRCSVFGVGMACVRAGGEAWSGVGSAKGCFAGFGMFARWFHGCLIAGGFAGCIFLFGAVCGGGLRGGWVGVGVEAGMGRSRGVVVGGCVSSGVGGVGCGA